jgi:hypothetical protein
MTTYQYTRAAYVLVPSVFGENIPTAETACWTQKWLDPYLHPSEKPARRQLQFTHLSHALADDVEVVSLRERDHVVHHSPARRIPGRNLRILLLGEEPAQQAHSLFVANLGPLQRTLNMSL